MAETSATTTQVADFHFPQLSWLVPPEKLNSAEEIAKFNGALLQSHGIADQTIPFSSGEKIFKNANEPKELVAIELADHNDWMNVAYLKKLDEFIQQVAPVGNSTRDPAGSK